MVAVQVPTELVPFIQEFVDNHLKARETPGHHGHNDLRCKWINGVPTIDNEVNRKKQLSATPAMK